MSLIPAPKACNVPRTSRVRKGSRGSESNAVVLKVCRLTFGGASWWGLMDAYRVLRWHGRQVQESEDVWEHGWENQWFEYVILRRQTARAHWSVIYFFFWPAGTVPQNQNTSKRQDLWSVMFFFFARGHRQRKQAIVGRTCFLEFELTFSHSFWLAPFVINREKAHFFFFLNCLPVRSQLGWLEDGALPTQAHHPRAVRSRRNYDPSRRAVSKLAIHQLQSMS